MQITLLGNSFGERGRGGIVAKYWGTRLWLPCRDLAESRNRSSGISPAGTSPEGALGSKDCVACGKVLRDAVVF